MPLRNPATVARQASLANLGLMLSQMREQRQMSLRDLAQQTGLTSSYLSQLERGRFQDIGIEKFARIVAALNLSADAVLRASGHLPPTNHRQK